MDRLRLRSSTLRCERPATPARTVSAQLRLLDPELRLVLEPSSGLAAAPQLRPAAATLLFPSPTSCSLPLLPCPPLERGFPPADADRCLRAGFFFSLANIDWRATSEIRCCLGELDPALGPAPDTPPLGPGLAAAGLLLPGAALGVLVLGVVVISRPAAVRRDAAAPPLAVVLDVEDIVVFARVILGFEADDGGAED